LAAGCVERSLQIHADMRLAFASPAAKIPARKLSNLFLLDAKEELLRLLEARDQRDATRFGLVWEANEIERDKALNSDFMALDLVPEQCVGSEPWRNLIIEGDNFDALR
jgi:adenine-specific DNA-methyltransferase